MLTPEYLNSIDFNKVVRIYQQLNLDITVDLIKKVESTDITVSKAELRTLISTNGLDVFEKALKETNGISAEVKQELTKLFVEVMQEDLTGYADLYEYRDKKLALSKSQTKILEQGILSVDKELKNLTRTIAFRGKQEYLSAVNRAYVGVVTGGLDYITAIDKACKDLAKQGVTLKDSAGRNVSLETAVRRNVLMGVQQTANNVNKDIEKELGCNGYQVTAHSGARPTHAEAQGKQYALTKENAKKYNVGYWDDVKDLWNEYNCRHTYVGIILGISTPVYTKSELDDLKNEKVMYNGNMISVYDATQIQRAKEREIRYTKRELKSLQDTNIDTQNISLKLNRLQNEYREFCKETDLTEQRERLKIY